ncbi:hypothetical protein SOVF_043940 [Spinacia oleracea]|uniref:Chymotrypsin inhibitor I, A, B and C subunits-like n=1 Tax=Spinacia oleracea TaxID=3562 RepID=A0A9R0JP98_SPIOL|nr:chymotrypsin inhibitor I, A, B and C subunits-like [Spinacia oleracea]KNA21308.1 hypothetical protein SOVF_043940 [Spinacia oleracea]
MSSCQENISMCQGKKSWPELVGKDGNKAAEIIKSENCFVKQTPVLPEGSKVTMDYRCDRVRVFVDACGKVVQTPNIG